MYKKLVFLISFVVVLSLSMSVAEGADPSLVGWWKFDEGSETTAYDTSDYGNDGTLQNGPQWVNGQLATALQFDGVDDFVEVPHAAILTVDNEVAVMAWINAERHNSAAGDWQAILAKSNDPRSYSFYTYTDGTLHFSTSSGGAYVGSNSSGQVPLNEWVHVCAMVSAGQHVYYIGGEPAGTSQSGINLPGAADTATVRIGATHEGGNNFLGMIDDARIYNRALTQEEVQEAMLGADIQKARNPDPADGETDVPLETNLTWTRGAGAVTDEFYFGTESPPSLVTLIPGTSPALYDPDPDLIPSTTYYWQIVEVNSPDRYEGPIWEFSTISGKTSVLFPADGDVIPGQVSGDNIYTWIDFAAGPTTETYECFFSDNREDVVNRESSASLGVPPFTGMLRYYVGFPGIPPYEQSLVRETTYYWCVDGSDAFGRTFGGDIWQFSIQGYRAFEPDPGDGAVLVDTDVLLEWRPGISVTEHDVYMGTDWDDVNDAVYDFAVKPPEFVETVTLPSYQCVDLPPETQLYWRIDEIYNRMGPTFPGESYKGAVWAFSTGMAIPGLAGEYYHHTPGTSPAGFESKVLVRLDPQIDFDWGDPGAPDPSMNVDNFSIRWTGQLAVPRPGETYTFTTETDDGVRLWVDDQLIIDQWIEAAGTRSGSIHLDNFGPYDIKMEYFEYTSPAFARLMWESASVPYGVIPSNFLAATSDEAKAAWTAYGPDPRDRGFLLPDEDLEFRPTLSWVPGLYSSTHELYFSTDFDDVNDRTVARIVVSDPCYTTGLLDMDQTYYWRIDESNSLGPAPGEWPGDVWSFTPVSSGYVVREWWLGIGGVLIPDLTGNPRYPDDPDGSELLTTFEGPTGWADDYGSRIHGWLRPGVSGNYTFWIATDDGGELWLSTDDDPCNVELISWITEGNWADPRQWYSGNVVPSNPIALDGRRKYYISALMKEGGGGDNIAAAWQGPAQPNPPIAGDDGAIIDGQFLSASPYDPPYATNPNPIDGATNVQDTTPALEWWPGGYVQSTGGHRLYFSSDFDDVNDRSVSPVVLTDPCHPITTMLDLGSTYYWAVDEVNSLGPVPGLWPGRKVWSFTMSECLSLENVEDYNDREELRDAWTDGKASVAWGGSYPYHYVVSGGSSGSNLNISTEVGTYWNGASSSEPVPPALPGSFNTQSLVLHYDNDGSTFTPYTNNPAEEKWVYPSPYYSEIEAETVADLETGQNWTGDGLKSLVMWFTGHPLSDGSYDSANWPAFTMQARGRDIWGRRDEFFFLGKYPLRVGATISVRVLSMDNTHPWAKAGVMIRENMTPYSKYAGVFITPGSGVTFQWRDATNGETETRTKPLDRDGNLIRPPVYVQLDRSYTGVFEAAYSYTGSSPWFDVNEPDQLPESPTILMGTPEDPCVYIGAALSSHNEDETCTASFANFTLTTIPPTWVNGNIGTNSAEQLYVALEDTMGNMTVIEHPDPEAAIQTDWQEWNIELTEFGIVNTNAVKKVYIGLGDRAAPVEGGSGTIYIDDLRACPPRCVPLFGHPLADIAEPYDCIVNEKDLMVLAGDWLMRDRLITTSAPSDVNLTALYEFEGNYNDTSVHGYHLTDPCGTAPGFDTGMIDQALALDGVGEHLAVSGVGIDGNTPKSIACWAKAEHTSITDWSLIFGFTSTNGVANSHFNIGSLGGPGGVGAHVWGWEATIFTDEEALEWRHYAMTYDGGTIEYYGDGMLVGSVDRILINDDLVHVGKRGTQASTFPGLVDDARIYSVVLSEAEIVYLATNGAPTLHIPIPSPADIYQSELPGSQWLNFRDYSVMTGSWLEEILWPTP